MSVIRLLFLLFCMGLGVEQVRAASYVFPGNLPATCVANAGTYNCTGLMLAWGDTVTIGSPTTITVKGKFDAQNGQINAAGSVADLKVVVTGDFVCNQCRLQGDLSVGGTTDLSYQGIIGGSITASNDVKLGTSSQIGGDINAADQKVTVQSYVRVLGSLTVGSLSDTGTSTYYGGSITATNGSVTLSNLSLVAGNVTVSNKDETLTLNSAQAKVNGCVMVNSNKSGAIALGWQAAVGGVCCSPGNSGCKDSCVSNNSGSSMPAICTPGTGTTADTFSAIDSAYGATLANFQSGHIYTKLAGVAFPLQVAALYNNQIQTDYISKQSLNIKLVDNSDGLCGTDATRKTACASSACNGKAAVSGGSQTLAYTSTDKGIKTTASFTLNSAYANLVAVMTDGTTTACSIDSFAVRPTLFSSVTSSASNSALSGAPKFKADTDSFTLTATANAGGYSGVPKVNTAAMSANGAGWVVGRLTPTVFANATPGASTSVATGTFKYGEVGHFRLLGYDPASDTTSPRGVYDDDWVTVDSASTKNDCIAGSYSNSKDADGKYGCLFGLLDSGASTPNSVLFGRFVPDHFSYLGGGITPFCAAATPFTYMGQPALGIAYRLQAENGSGTVTRNYSQTLGYPVSNPTLAAEDQAVAHQGCDLASRIGGLASAQWVAGVYALNDSNANNVPDSAAATFSRPTVPVDLTTASCAANRSSAGGPFWLLDLGVSMIDSDAGAKLALPDMDAASSGTCTTCTARKIGTTAVAYGRLWLNNAYGSEMLPLAVPIQAQYWTTSGWLKSSNDSCTALTQPTRQDSGNGGLVFYAPPDTARNALAPGEVIAQMGGSTANSVSLLSGDARLVLRSPGTSTQGPGSGNFGYVDVIGSKLGAAAWLPPTGNARACFGACGPRSPVIYLRESY